MLVMVFVLFPIVGLDFGHEYSSILSGILKMTDTTRDLIERMADELDLYRQLARDDCTSTHPFADEARAYLAQPEPEGLPPGYIDSEHTGNDRELLEVFYRACLSEGGSADEIHLRGLKAVIALDQSELEGPTNEELEEFALEHGGGYFNCDCQVEADILTRKHVSNYRAVLARWGRPITTTTETP
jgi:hypothetical protein